MIIRSLVLGLIALHDNNIVHRDLRSKNILINVEENKYVAKIADFGCAKFVTETVATNNEGHLTLKKLRPPELPQDDSQVAIYSKKADFNGTR